jgi:rRNA maturation endonuclease Nob1
MEKDFICWGCLKISKSSELKKDELNRDVCPKCGDVHISQTYNASNC